MSLFPMLTFKRRSVKNQNEMRVFIFKVFNKKQVDMFFRIEASMSDWNQVLPNIPKTINSNSIVHFKN